jgi:hypothetical protein
LELEFSLSRIRELREKLLKAAPCGALELEDENRTIFFQIPSKFK